MRTQIILAFLKAGIAYSFAPSIWEKYEDITVEDDPSGDIKIMGYLKESK